jgi:hypothetical protein
MHTRHSSLLKPLLFAALALAAALPVQAARIKEVEPVRQLFPRHLRR